ncbi:MAG: hypothetical protein AAB458_02130 [Patescibacteria group bacterium]
MQRFFTYIFILFLFFGAFHASAAILLVEEGVIPENGERSFSLMLDTEGETVNAIEGQITVSGDALLSDVRDTASIVSLWVTPLTIKDNALFFSGTIPGGFTGKGEVLTLVFKGTASGNISINIGDVSVFYDDGLGTQTDIAPTSIIRDVVLGAAADPAITDTIPPEPFSIGLINVGMTPEEPLYALIFATDDKQTGIDHYEVQERGRGDDVYTMWVSTASPYVVQDQTLSSHFAVRAYDNAGNVQEEVYKPEGGKGMIGGVLILLGLIVLVMVVRYARRLRTKRSV